MGFGLAGLITIVAATGFGPSKSDAKLSKEQLEYSKKLYAEGEKAMAAENYALALDKYKEGYRYAPELHMFTYNIASAADAMDDCRTAYTYYQMFVDRVPKHPKRGSAKKRLATLTKECRFDPESETINAAPPDDGETPGDGGSSKRSRKEREARRAMNEALAELGTAYEVYTMAKSRYPKTKAFARAARRKKNHAKRLRKVAVELGVELEDPPTAATEVADTAKRACREAESQEKRIAAKIEKVLEHYDDAKTYRVSNKILGAAERRDRLAFDACS